MHEIGELGIAHDGRNPPLQHAERAAEQQQRREHRGADGQVGDELTDYSRPLFHGTFRLLTELFADRMEKNTFTARRLEVPAGLDRRSSVSWKIKRCSREGRPFTTPRRGHSLAGTHGRRLQRHPFVCALLLLQVLRQKSLRLPLLREFLVVRQHAGPALAGDEQLHAVTVDGQHIGTLALGFDNIFDTALHGFDLGVEDFPVPRMIDAVDLYERLLALRRAVAYHPDHEAIAAAVGPDIRAHGRALGSEGGSEDQAAQQQAGNDFAHGISFRQNTVPGCTSWRRGAQRYCAGLKHVAANSIAGGRVPGWPVGAAERGLLGAWRSITAAGPGSSVAGQTEQSKKPGVPD